jgi:hypothetical protein
MIEEQENDNNDQEYKPFTIEGLVKTMSILFVLAVYLYIFLKILILK